MATVKISPVSTQLVKAVVRSRDPRLKNSAMMVDSGKLQQPLIPNVSVSSTGSKLQQSSASNMSVSSTSSKLQQQSLVNVSVSSTSSKPQQPSVPSVSVSSASSKTQQASVPNVSVSSTSSKTQQPSVSDISVSSTSNKLQQLSVSNVSVHSTSSKPKQPPSVSNISISTTSVSAVSVPSIPITTSTESDVKTALSSSTSLSSIALPVTSLPSVPPISVVAPLPQALPLTVASSVINRSVSDGVATTLISVTTSSTTVVTATSVTTVVKTTAAVSSIISSGVSGCYTNSATSGSVISSGSNNLTGSSIPTTLVSSVTPSIPSASSSDLNDIDSRNLNVSNASVSVGKIKTSSNPDEKSPSSSPVTKSKLYSESKNKESDRKTASKLDKHHSTISSRGQISENDRKDRKRSHRSKKPVICDDSSRDNNSNKELSASRTSSKEVDNELLQSHPRLEFHQKDKDENIDFVGKDNFKFRFSSSRVSQSTLIGKRNTEPGNVGIKVSKKKRTKLKNKKALDISYNDNKKSKIGYTDNRSTDVTISSEKDKNLGIENFSNSGTGENVMPVSTVKEISPKKSVIEDSKSDILPDSKYFSSKRSSPKSSPKSKLAKNSPIRPQSREGKNIERNLFLQEEKDEVSSSPTPPLSAVEVSDKFKEMRASTLKRMKTYARQRESSASPPVSEAPASISSDAITALPSKTVHVTSCDTDLRVPPTDEIKRKFTRLINFFYSFSHLLYDLESLGS